MKTVITLIVDHKRQIPQLAKLAEQRVYNIPGVEDVNVHGAACETDLITLPVIEMPEEVTA